MSFSPNLSTYHPRRDSDGTGECTAGKFHSLPAHPSSLVRDSNGTGGSAASEFEFPPALVLLYNDGLCFSKLFLDRFETSIQLMIKSHSRDGMSRTHVPKDVVACSRGHARMRWRSGWGTPRRHGIGALHVSRPMSPRVRDGQRAQTAAKAGVSDERGRAGRWGHNLIDSGKNWPQLLQLKTGIWRAFERCLVCLIISNWTWLWALTSLI